MTETRIVNRARLIEEGTSVLEALEIARDEEHAVKVPEILLSLNRMTDEFRKQGELESAVACCERSCTLLLDPIWDDCADVEMDLAYAKGLALMHFGSVCLAGGQTDQSLDCYSLAREAFQAHSRSCSEAVAWMAQGRVHSLRKEWFQAMTRYMLSLDALSGYTFHGAATVGLKRRIQQDFDKAQTEYARKVAGVPPEEAPKGDLQQGAHLELEQPEQGDELEASVRDSFARVEELFQRDMDARPSYKVVDQASAAGARTQQIPIFDIAAGPSILVEEPEEFLTVEQVTGRATLALRVHGESMIEAGILDGDLVLVEEKKDDLPSSAKVVAARITDREGETSLILKRYRREKDHILLEPANERAPLIIITSDSPRQAIRADYQEKHPNRGLEVFSQEEAQVIGWVSALIREQVR